MPLDKSRKRPTTTASGVPLKILRAAEESPYLRLGIYGSSGAGKTYLAGTAQWYEHTAPVFIIDGYDSTDTVLGEPIFEGVEAYKIRSLDQLDAVFDWLWGFVERGEEFPYKTVVLDEIDELHTASLRELMTEVVRNNASRNIDLASQQEWGIVRNKFLRIIDGFRALPCNVVYMCVPNMKDDKIRQEKEVLSFGLPGKLSDDVAKRLSVVAYLDKDEKKVKGPNGFEVVAKRVLKFEAGLKARTKVRGPSRAERLGAELEEPTMEKIYRLWYNI